MNTAITSDRARFPVVRLYNADYNNILFVLFSDIYNYNIYICIYDCYNNCNVILLYTLCSLLYCNNTLF